MATAKGPSWKSRLLALSLLAAASAWTLSLWKPEWFGGERSSPSGHAEHKKSGDEYYCPMHPRQRSDKPGNCPICNMAFVKVETATPREASGEIFLTAERQQRIGIRTEVAARRPLVREIRTVGKVAMDDSRTSHIHTKVAGFIEHVFVDYVGRTVKKGEPLFTIYSPELVASQEEYLLALRSAADLKQSALPWVAKGSGDLLEASRRRLALFDVSEEQIRQLEASGKVARELTIFSPVGGTVTERAAYHHGRYVTPDTDLYTIVDLSAVWINGEVFEGELPYVRVGQSVEIDFPFARAGRRSGKITYIAPTLRAETRTVEVRLEAPNPDHSLRPGMTVDFTLRAGLGSPITVPTDAVLDTGSHQYVFVDKGEGRFEPRHVEAGAETGGWREVRSGLREGERVVTAANFLLDSEARLRGLIGGASAPGAGMPAGHKH
jgi:Cu(I)/Ag(I) efflux system membrane fusion protein